MLYKKRVPGITASASLQRSPRPAFEMASHHQKHARYHTVAASPQRRIAPLQASASRAHRCSACHEEWENVIGHHNTHQQQTSGITTE